ncbi:MAG TPA: helix-turn-helix transcriptional regulator [Terriglobia bacterium]
MDIGKRLRQLREERNLSQGDIERETGLYRSYISRVEGGHMRPALPTLERFARALDVPLYWLFYPGTGHPVAPNPEPSVLEDLADEAGPTGTEARFLMEMHGLWKDMSEPDRRLLLGVADRLAACRRPAERKAARGRPRISGAKSARGSRHAPLTHP